MDRSDCTLIELGLGIENILKFVFNSLHIFMQTESALFHDAVRTFASALRELHSTKEIMPRALRCTSTNRWDQGMQILQFMDMVKKVDFVEKYNNNY